jgi:hypothetical protein
MGLIFSGFQHKSKIIGFAGSMEKPQKQSLAISICRPEWQKHAHCPIKSVGPCSGREPLCGNPMP